MERSPAKPPTSRRRPPAAPAAALPEDDRFAPHKGQKIDVIYVIGRSVELIIARPREVLLVMLASFVVAALLLGPLLAAGLVENALWAALGIDAVMHPVNLLVMLVFGWACALLLQAPLVGAAIEVHTFRRGLALEFFRRGAAQFSSLLVASLAMLGITAGVLVVALVLQLLVLELTALVPVAFIVVMLRFVGMVAVLVAALRVITAFSLVVPIMLVERLAPGDALRRSWELGWPNSQPMFMALLFPTLLVQGVLLVLNYLPTFISLPCNLLGLLGLSLYQSVLVPVSYVAIREYVDGLDPERLLARNRR
jgi:hypothetical protein